MKNLKIKLLSWLLFHANRIAKDDNYYSVKSRILSKYGRNTGYVVQFIEGKKCWSCGGSGVHKHYSWATGKLKDIDACWNCFDGWYKRPVWVIHNQIQLGEHSFLTPFQRVYEKPENNIPTFDGYVNNTNTEYSSFALFVLMLLHEKGYLKRWYKSTGVGYKPKWNTAEAWINNIIHLIKYRKQAIPVRKFYQKSEQRRIQRQMNSKNYSPYAVSEDDLPF